MTFGNDAAGVVNRDFTGIESLLWASDYPHPEGTWPHTRETLERIFAACPARPRAGDLLDHGAALRPGGPGRVAVPGPRPRAGSVPSVADPPKSVA